MHKKSWVLGFDETNNGFNLRSKNPHHSSSLILTGYFSQNSSEEPEISEYENKNNCRFFTTIRENMTDLDEILKRANYYFSNNPDFFYVPISKEFKKTKPISILKAEAIAAITFKFFLSYDADPLKTEIVIDETDGEIPSEEVNYILEMYLKKAGLNIPHHSKRSADSRVKAVKKADMAGYYIAAVHLLGKSPKWPYRRKKIGLGDLEKLLVKFSEREPQKYF